MKKKALFLVSIFLILIGCLQKEPQELLHLVLQVDTEDAIKIETDMEIFRLKEHLKNNLVNYKTIVRDKDVAGRFTIQEFEPEKEALVRELIDEHLTEWDASFRGNSVSVAMKQNTITYLEDMCVLQTVDVIRKRLKLMGLRRAVIERDEGDKDRIIVEIPSLRIKDPERVKSIIKTRAFLEFRLVQAGPASDKEALLQDYGSEVPEGMEVVGPSQIEEGYYLLSIMAIVTGKDLKSVRVTKDEWNNPAIQVNFIPEAAERFSRFTADNIDRPLSIVFDGKVQMVVIIRDRISDSAVIHGNFTAEEAEDLALTLRSGGLPAGIKYLEEKIVVN